MEDASKAIEIAVGIIIFIIALTLTIIIYSNLNNAIENAVAINSTTSSIVTGGVDDISQIKDIVYDESEIFFMIQDMIRKADTEAPDYEYDEYSSYSNGTVVSVIIDRKTGTDYIYTDLVNTKSTAIMQFVNAMQGTTKNYSGFNNIFPGRKFTIDYVYKYSNIERLNLANHQITSITFKEI